MTPPALDPFADDAHVRLLAGLTIENGRGCVALHGSLDLTRDRRGLARARALRAVLDAVVAVLEAQPDLPAASPAPAESAVDAPAEAPVVVRNPFA